MTYFPPMSTNGIEPLLLASTYGGASYLVVRALSAADGVSRVGYVPSLFCWLVVVS